MAMFPIYFTRNKFLFLVIPFSIEERTGTPSESRVEKVFFPVHHEEYTGDEQFHAMQCDKGPQSIWQESTAERVVLDVFAHFVESQGGKLDLTTVAGFGCCTQIQTSWTISV